MILEYFTTISYCSLFLSEVKFDISYLSHLGFFEDKKKAQVQQTKFFGTQFNHRPAWTTDIWRKGRRKERQFPQQILCFDALVLYPSNHKNKCYLTTFQIMVGFFIKFYIINS